MDQYYYESFGFTPVGFSFRKVHLNHSADAARQKLISKTYENYYRFLFVSKSYSMLTTSGLGIFYNSRLSSKFLKCLGIFYYHQIVKGTST